MQNEIFSASGISRRFPPNWVLKDVSLSIRHGEILGLIGPNGAGKTTLFECLAGQLLPDAGTISFSGTGRRHLFYLPDNVAPFAEQTVLWAANFVAGCYGSEKGRIPELLGALRLEHLTGARIGTLSKGERKRATLLMALITPCELLMLDEPFDGLDLRQTREVMSLLRIETEQGRSLLLSIHQLIDAARICDRLVLLSGGQTRGTGTIQELAIQAGLPEDAGLEDIFLALT